MSETGPQYRAPALDKGLDVLELLAEHAEGLTQAEIAKALGRSPSELYRMLDRLVHRGYVRRSGRDDRMTLGLKLFALATGYPPMQRLLRVAQEVATEVAERTLQSCHLALYKDGELFVAVLADSPGRFALGVRLGAATDLLSTGSGHVMLTFQSNARRRRMLRAYAERTGQLGAPDPLAHGCDMQVIRRRGHVRRPSGQIAGMTDLVVPVFGRTRDAVAALAIPYVRRLDPPDAPGEEACLAALGEAAASLSTQLPRQTFDALDPARTDAA